MFARIIIAILALSALFFAYKSAFSNNDRFLGSFLMVMGLIVVVGVIYALIQASQQQQQPRQ